MSDTHHHGGQKDRHAGHDLWGKRPLAGMDYSAENKKRSRRLERKRYKQSQTSVLDDHLDEVYEMKINEGHLIDYYHTCTGEDYDNY